MLGHGLPHGADWGHSSRKLLGGGGGGDGVGGDGGGGGATSDGGGVGTGAVPPVRPAISVLTHDINAARAPKSSETAGLAKPAARSWHSAEGAALAAPGATAHSPSAKTRAQIRARGRLSARTLFMARPPDSRAAAGHGATELPVFCALGCADIRNGTNGHSSVPACQAHSVPSAHLRQPECLNFPPDPGLRAGAHTVRRRPVRGVHAVGRVWRHQAYVPSSIAGSR